MRVTVTLTIGTTETMLEGDAHVFAGEHTYIEEGEVVPEWDELEDRGIGFWLDNWLYCKPDAKPHKKSRVFCPWSSVLMVEAEKKGGKQ